jgi:heat shock protein HspQ
MQKTHFYIGQIIQHKLFDYRGIIFDVDFKYSGTDDWYDNVAHSRPSKNQPWYRVLVDNATHETYVAEQNLNNSSDTQKSINNPFIGLYFDKSADNIYKPKIIKN